MEPPTPTLPPPPSLTDGVDGDQIPPISKPDLEKKKNSGPAAKPSFADITKSSIRSSWSSVRANTESRELHHKEQAQAVWFTNHIHDYIAAVPYYTKTHLINDVTSAIVTTFPNALRINFFTPGVVLIAFHTAEELASAVGATVDCAPSPLPVLATVFSSGSRIKIRAEDSPIGSMDCKQLAQKVFGPYGKVLAVNEHYLAGTRVLSSSFDFTLEIPFGTPQDFMIPRVAAVDNVNILFSWSGSKFCYRCGDASHTKLQCPKPLDFSMCSTSPLEEPLMARVFPDPDAPLRELVKKPAPLKPVPGSNKKVPSTESDWTEVSRGKNKKRSRVAFSGGGVTSASDSDSPKPPPRKQAPQQKGSNLASRPTMIVALNNNKKDVNSARSPSAPSTTKAVPALAPAKTDEATSSQESAKTVEATQLSSLGDAPKQQTDPQQQETEQQPEQQQLEQQSKQQSEQHLGPLAPAEDAASPPIALMEEDDRTEECVIWEYEDEEDSHMSSKKEDKSAKAEKQKALMAQLLDAAPKALGTRAARNHKKPTTKSG